MCDKGIIELVDDARKIKQTQDRKLVAETQSEITCQCVLFSQSETLIIPETQKSLACITLLFLRGSLNAPELPSGQSSTTKRSAKHLENSCTCDLAHFQKFL